MIRSRRGLTTVATLAAGVSLGAWLATAQRPARGGDRQGDWSTTTGAVSIDYNERTKIQSSQEALYFLDYTGGRLLGAVPVLRQSYGGSKLINGFVERDLFADFKIIAERAEDPHFLMTTGSLGAFGAGWSPLFVFETTTRQVATYRIQSQAVGLKSQPKFELLDVKTIAESSRTTPQSQDDRPARRRERPGAWSLATAAMTTEYNDHTKVQSAREALFFLDVAGSRLVGAIPSPKQSVSGSQMIDGFVERDLAADFKIDLDAPTTGDNGNGKAPAPRYLMTAGSLGAYGAGWSPLFVFETTTKQVAAYKILTQAVGAQSKPRIELLEVESFAELPPAAQP